MSQETFTLICLAIRPPKKVTDICEQFSLYQTITDPTHFTENSSSLIDIILTSEKNNLIYNGVTDPFLSQETRYHCPVYGIFKFIKHKKSFSRRIWRYEQGDDDSLRTKVANTEWDALTGPDINIYTRNITGHINSLTAECVPYRTVRIRPSDPPWITTAIRKLIRNVKEHIKRQPSKILRLWNKFKKIRNKVVDTIRRSKQKYVDRLSNKLNSESLSSKDWWSTLKAFITPSQNSSVPTLEKDGNIYSDETDKANVLNNFFTD